MQEDKPHDEKCYFGANAANRPPPRNRKNADKQKTPKNTNPSNNKTEEEERFKLLGPRLHSELHTEVTREKFKMFLPKIPQVVWQQPQDSHKRDPPYDTIQLKTQILRLQ